MILHNAYSNRPLSLNFRQCVSLVLNEKEELNSEQFMVAENVTNICCLTEVQKRMAEKKEKKVNVTKGAPHVDRGIAHVFPPDLRYPKSYELA